MPGPTKPRLPGSDRATIAKYLSVLELREVLGGPDWFAISFPEAHLGRCIMCTGGGCFVGVIEFKELVSLVESVDGDGDDAASVARVADELGSLAFDEFVRRGGSYVFLRPGDGLWIPPGHMFFQACAGYMQVSDAFRSHNDLAPNAGVTFMAPLLKFHCLQLRIARSPQCQVPSSWLYCCNLARLRCSHQCPKLR